MSGVVCIIILDGGKAQGAALELSKTIESSCVLVDYLQNDEYLHFDPADGQVIADFHGRALKTLSDLNAEINKLNADLARKYNRTTE
jgi:hypothetical protein